MIHLRRTFPLVFLMAFLLFPISCCQAKTFFPEYERALQSAKKDGKPVMLYFLSTYCPYCTLMERSTLADREIVKILAGFHVVRIDAEKNRALSQHYSVRAFPTFWFLEGSGKRILAAPGYMEKAIFKKLLEYVKGNHYKTQDLHRYLEKTK